MSDVDSLPLPAHQTKHLSTLRYPYLSHHFTLRQSNDGHSNGTALWLGAQCMSLFLVDTARKATSKATKPKAANGTIEEGGVRGSSHRPKAIELGSGIGLTALALASLGWDVLATDIQHVTTSVLAPNVAQNMDSVSPDFGTVQARELDWTVPPEAWTWDDPLHVASHSCPKECDEEDEMGRTLLAPPFDLIVTSDTLYARELVTPLLRTLHHLSHSHHTSDDSTSIPPRTQIYLAFENRDPDLIVYFLEQAREEWHFTTERVSSRKVAKAMTRGGVLWDKQEWDGVEIWKFGLGGKSVVDDDTLDS